MAESKKLSTSRNLNIIIIKRFKWIAIFLVVLGIGAGGYQIKGQRDQIKLQQENDQGLIVSNIKTRETQIEQLRKKTQNYEFVERQSMQVIRQMLPTVDQEQAVLLTIENIVKQSGFSLMSIELGKPSAVQNYFVDSSGSSLPIVSIPYRVSITNPTINYEKIKQFLNDVSNKYLIINIGELQMGEELFKNEQPTSDNQRALSLGFEFDIFFWDNRLELAASQAGTGEDTPKAPSFRVTTP